MANNTSSPASPQGAEKAVFRAHVPWRFLNLREWEADTRDPIEAFEYRHPPTNDPESPHVEPPHGSTTTSINENIKRVWDTPCSIVGETFEEYSWTPLDEKIQDAWDNPMELKGLIGDIVSRDNEFNRDWHICSLYI
ncbi:hypothetical protein BJX99DRAFT_254055 [Aspergillus californicus]